MIRYTLVVLRYAVGWFFLELATANYNPICFALGLLFLGMATMNLVTKRLPDPRLVAYILRRWSRG